MVVAGRGLGSMNLEVSNSRRGLAAHQFVYVLRGVRERTLAGHGDLLYVRESQFCCG